MKVAGGEPRRQLGLALGPSLCCTRLQPTGGRYLEGYMSADRPGSEFQLFHTQQGNLTQVTSPHTALISSAVKWG